MKPIRHFWSYLAQYFTEWEEFQIKFVEEIKKKHFCDQFFEGGGGDKLGVL